VSLALELLYYDAALIQLMQLRKAVQYPFIPPKPMRRGDVAYVCQMAHGANGNGLLLPHQVQFQCQPAIEALRITQYIFKKLDGSCGNGQYIAPSPFAIIYLALADEPEIYSCVASTLLKCPPFNENKYFFEEFKVNFHGGLRMWI
jgi:hypothetical protein